VPALLLHSQHPRSLSRMSKTIVTREDLDRLYLCGTPETHSGRLLKKGVQQGHSE
jgi:hypothetical protein